MQKPTIHLNGSSAAHLTEAWREAYSKLREAFVALQQTGPNARDYYPQGDSAYRIAAGEHLQRLTSIEKVMNELVELQEHVEDSQAECSICRRRHGREIEHPCE